MEHLRANDLDPRAAGGNPPGRDGVARREQPRWCTSGGRCMMRRRRQPAAPEGRLRQPGERPHARARPPGGTMKRTVDVEERLPLLQSIPLSLQHLFAMFGATVLVPFLVGLDTSVTLFTSGVGTLVYIFITKGKIPAYLGSSFAFIAALSGIMGA